MPAAAVIPAPRAYINVVAVKKPVVGFENKACDVLGESRLRVRRARTVTHGFALRHAGLSTGQGPIHLGLRQTRSAHTPSGAPTDVTVSKPECSRQPSCVVEC